VQAALDISSSLTVPGAELSRAMVEVCGDPVSVPAATNPYVEQLADRLADVATPRGRWLRDALAAWVAAAGPDEELRLGAGHGDWTPWNMAYDGSALSVWDWERYAVNVPAGFDALHCSSQAPIMSRAQTPAEAVEALLARAGELLAPFGIDPAAAERVALLYLIALGARYEGDDQEAAGARLAHLEDWLLPALADRLGLTLELAGR
jgi:hypothetical protein